MKSLSIYAYLYHYAIIYEPPHEIFQQCGMCEQQSLRSACAYGQSDQSLRKSLKFSVTVKLLTEKLLVFLSLKGVCTGSAEWTLVKIPHCWKSYASAHIL